MRARIVVKIEFPRPDFAREATHIMVVPLVVTLGYCYLYLNPIQVGANWLLYRS